MPPTYFKSKRNGEKMELDDYIYNKISANSWKCEKRRKSNCPGAAALVGGEVKNTVDHDHDADPDEAQKQLAMARLYTLDPNEIRSARDAQNVIAQKKMGKSVISKMPKPSSVARVMQRRKLNESIARSNKDISSTAIAVDATPPDEPTSSAASIRATAASSMAPSVAATANVVSTSIVSATSTVTSPRASSDRASSRSVTPINYASAVEEIRQPIEETSITTNSNRATPPSNHEETPMDVQPISEVIDEDETLDKDESDKEEGLPPDVEAAVLAHLDTPGVELKPVVIGGEKFTYFDSGRKDKYRIIVLSQGFIS